MYIKSNFIPEELYYKFILPKFKDVPISIFNDYTPSLEELQINPYNILVIQEPNQLFGLHDWAIQNSEYFSCILTWGQSILDTCENAALLPFGTTFLHGGDKYKRLQNLKKQFEISFLCGPKKLIEGHYLRHYIWDKQSQLRTPLKFIFEGEKAPCFEHSMFHIAVENSQNKNYFTEKIVDAFLSKTVPVYWGCPNIGEFFDIRGMFILESENDFISLVNSLTEEDYYSRKEYVEYNYKVALHYAEYFTRFGSLLEEIIKLNNI
jgi:hypothetical protein